MNNPSNDTSTGISRRRFLETSAAVATTLGTLATGAPGVFAAGSDKVRVGLIGCGSRGAGAAMNCVLSTSGVEIVALGDVFPDRAVSRMGGANPTTSTDPQASVAGHPEQPSRWASAIRATRAT